MASIQEATSEQAREVTPPAEVYTERKDRFGAQRGRYNRRRYLAANLTVVSFIAIPVCLGVAIFGGPGIFYLLAAFSLGGFIAAFGWQAREDAHYRRFETLAALNEEGLLRLTRDWKRLPLRQTPELPDDLALADDLDLLGHASLQHLLGYVGTPAGRTTLQGWMLAPASPDVIRARQEAVAELAPLIDFRDELATGGRHMDMTPAGLRGFLAWAEDEPWLTRRPLLIWLSRLLPLLLFGLIVAQFTGLLAGPWWLLVIGLNLLFNVLAGKEVEESLARVADRQGVFRPYARLFHLVTAQPFRSAELRRVQADLAAGSLSAEGEMRKLGRIMVFADLRLSMFFGVLQATTLWTFHVLWFLERWRTRAGGGARRWMDLLSQADALGALAALKYDQPTWAFPRIVENAEKMRDATLVARNLGHPLLPPETCVGNDVSVGPSGRFLLVTGSNMSGKSTLLRAIGLNVVLAQMGGPACADELTLPPLALLSSIRVRDSLEEGVSYFMAELQRLKAVVSAAEAAHEQGARTAFFLLDEILHGTNTSERQVAARRIIRHLLAVGATGAVSTHDLTLADAPDLAASATQVHFTEQFARGPDGPTMRFDYTLRPGIATSTNALKLMEIVGLPVDEE
jgi:predicted ATPase